MRSTWHFFTVVLAATAASIMASSVVAQRSTTRGFTVGAHLQGASLTVDDGDPDGGGGFGARVGYGFNRRFTGYLEADAIVFDVANPDFGGYWSMVHADLGVRFNFANSTRRWVPFLEGALGARAVQVEDRTRMNGDSVPELNFSGGAASIGGGISFFATEKLAIETLMKLTGGTFEQVDVGNVSVRNLDIDASSFRFKLGLAWWP
jgi:hypothetical protein